MEFRDLKIQYKKYKNDIDLAIQGVINEANFINGKEVKVLENRLAKYVGVKHCISCANGTEAMSLLMMAWGLKKAMQYLFQTSLSFLQEKLYLFVELLLYL